MRSAVGPGAATGGALHPDRVLRTMDAWIGLGGNFADSESLIRESLSLLGGRSGVSVKRVSAVYRSRPWGDSDQADYFNAVAELETSLPAGDLLETLLDIEDRLGRTRDGRKWGPRCIDLDLLTYQDLKMDSAQLHLPHPCMHLRAFVLVPLLELEPGFEIPGIGKAQQALDRLGRNEVKAVRPVRWNRQETDR